MTSSETRPWPREAPRAGCPSPGCPRPTRGRAAAPGPRAVPRPRRTTRRRRPRRRVWSASRPALLDAWRSSQSASSSSASLSCSAERTGGRSTDLQAELVELEELLGRDRSLREPVERGEQRVARVGHRVDGAHRGRGRVVQLVGQAGRQGAEGDQRLALTDGRLDGSGGPEHAPDQVHRKGQPLLHQAAQLLRRHAQQPPGVDDPAGRQIDAVLVPRLEPARPAAGHVHPPDRRLLAADRAEQVDGAVEEHPQLSAGAPSWNTSSPGATLTSSPTATSWASDRR